jgi:predicted extracellular nuclease
VAALNLDNYFSELGSRGADSELELERQRAKLASVLQQLDADILALSELGNSTAGNTAARGAPASLTELLDDIAAATPDELAYRVSTSIASPEGTLRSAIAYRGRQLRAAGDSWFASDPAFRRAPLLQRFESAGGSFTLAVVHLKSKVCSGAVELVGPEGCGAEQRLEEARALLRELSALPAAQAEETLVIGDFNSDVLEAPLLELKAGGLLDLFVGLSPAERYSYVFEGEAAQLDHALAGSTLAARLRGAHIWHINADEPALLGYELSHPNRAYTADPRRSSDHDPIVVDLAP